VERNGSSSGKGKTMSKNESVDAASMHPIVLLPCPFCGFDATIAMGPSSRGDMAFCGACSDLRCRAEGPTCESKQDAAIRWNRRRRNDEIEKIIVDSITGWGKHFGVDTSCVNHDKRHPIWQQIFGLLTRLHADSEDAEKYRGLLD